MHKAYKGTPAYGGGTSYPFSEYNSVDDNGTAANKLTTPAVAEAVVIEAPVALGVNGEGQAAAKV